MRQAGRYLPEYRELREKFAFLDMVRRPDLAVEVSLQPWARFGMDAVILFSDILIPLPAMGVRLAFEEGVGPVLDRKIRTAADVAGLARPRVRTSLPFTLEAIEALRHRVGDEAALVGFVGAPWTLACYMTEGKSGDFAAAVAMARDGRQVLTALLDVVTDVLTEYAVQQAHAGCDAIQIFDTWGGLLSPDDYADLALPRVQKICAAVREAGAVSILFIRESEKHLAAMRASGAEVASLGSSTDLAGAWATLGDAVATQGNIHPEALLRSPASVVEHTEELLAVVGNRPGHIVNLGHGVLPQTRPDCVKALVDAVKSFIR